MTATAPATATPSAKPNPARPTSASAAAPVRIALPAYPGEALYLEPKFIDNSQVVRADNPSSSRSAWRAAFAVVTVSAISAGLMLPSAFQVITGQRIVAARAEGKQLRAEIAEYQALIAKHSGRQHLEEYAKQQDLLTPSLMNVQHITPKGSYAQNGFPAGK
jgi:hypothetical protein